MSEVYARVQLITGTGAGAGERITGAFCVVMDEFRIFKRPSSLCMQRACFRMRKSMLRDASGKSVVGIEMLLLHVVWTQLGGSM